MRPKQNESTLCKWTIDGSEIKEGDILGYGDNFECIVFYNPFEAQFVALEFGNDEGGFREHTLTSYTVKWDVLGHRDSTHKRIKGFSKKFDYIKSIQEYYA